MRSRLERLEARDCPSTVAVVDYGVNYDHPALASRIHVNRGEDDGKPVRDFNGNGYIDGSDYLTAWQDGIDQDHNGFTDDIVGWNFVEGNNNPYRDGHGTHVAGIIAANSGADILPVRVLDPSLSYSQSDAAIAAGLRYAGRMGANVVNASIGFKDAPPGPPQMHDAVRDLADRGIPLVASAGNDGKKYDRHATEQNYPAAFPSKNVVVVGALNGHGRWKHSNYGSIVKVWKPWVNVYSTLGTSGYGYDSGTSMAAAFESAALAAG